MRWYQTSNFWRVDQGIRNGSPHSTRASLFCRWLFRLLISGEDTEYLGAAHNVVKEYHCIVHSFSVAWSLEKIWSGLYSRVIHSRVIHSSHFWLIFGYFLFYFLITFLKMNSENDSKMKSKRSLFVFIFVFTFCCYFKLHSDTLTHNDNKGATRRPDATSASLLPSFLLTPLPPLPALLQPSTTTPTLTPTKCCKWRILDAMQAQMTANFFPLAFFLTNYLFFRLQTSFNNKPQCTTPKSEQDRAQTMIKLLFGP